MNAHLLANLKAYVALVGMIATALLDQFTGSTVLTVIASVCTVFGVWAATNTPEQD